jgi:AhpD family alkylhydroperoxidase
MGFYKATYGKSKIDLKTKEFIAIAASLTSGCKGCLEGHLKKAKKERDERRGSPGHCDHAWRETPPPSSTAPISRTSTSAFLRPPRG